MKFILLILLPGLCLPELSRAQANSTTITAIANALGYQAELAPDTVFVVFGSGLGPASIVTANAPGYPTSLGGTSITFTGAAGGSAITAKMVYSVATQVAGLLPSSIAPGMYSVQVTNNGQTSTGQSVQVVARSLGIATVNSSGSGVAQATIGNVNGGISLTRFTSGSVSFGGYDWTLTPAHPGDTLVFWGTGGGADPANDIGGSSGDQTVAGNFSVLVNGRQIVPLFSGTSSGYPGLWQLNFTLPNDIATGCFNWVQISSGGRLSNGVNLPIAVPGQNACAEQGLTTSFLAKLDEGATVTAASFAVGKLTSTVTQETASGFAGRYTSAAWLLPNIGPKIGLCSIYDRTFPVGGTDPSSPTAELDAGVNLQLTGPNLPAGLTLGITSTATGPFYLGTAATGSLTGGTYKLTGVGGSQVGPLSASALFPTNFSWTNLSSVTGIDRTQPLTINWIASGLDQVYIQIGTNTRGSGNQRIVTLACHVSANLGTYTIPAALLAYLQPSATANIAVQGMTLINSFTANLIPSGQLDFGGLTANLGSTKTISVQ